MTFDYLRAAVVEDGNDFYFTYNGTNCGIEIHGTLETFDLLWGDESKTISGGFDVAINAPFFDGKSFMERGPACSGPLLPRKRRN